MLKLRGESETTMTLEVRETGRELTLPPAQEVASQLQEIRNFQEMCRKNLTEGLDYGVIPGTGSKATLFKPGAEKMIRLLGLSDEYEIESVEDWDKPLFAYKIRCRLRHIASGNLVGEGVGEANSMETKWRYRWMWPNDVPEDRRVGLATKQVSTRNGPVTQYRVPNDEIYSEINTILKMGKKRALVDAALSAGRLSEIFTQDMEEHPQAAQVEAVGDSRPQAARPPAPAAAQAGGSEICPNCGGKKRLNYKVCYNCNQQGRTEVEVQAKVVEEPPPVNDPNSDALPDEWPAEVPIRAANDEVRVTMARQVLGMLLEAGEANRETFDNCVYGLGFTQEELGALFEWSVPETLVETGEMSWYQATSKLCHWVIDVLGSTVEPESETPPASLEENPWGALVAEAEAAGITMDQVLGKGVADLDAFVAMGGTVEIARKRLEAAKKGR